MKKYTCQFCSRDDLSMDEEWRVEVHMSPYTVPQFANKCIGSRSEPFEQSRTLTKILIPQVEAYIAYIKDSVDKEDDKYLPELDEILSILRNK